VKSNSLFFLYVLVSFMDPQSETPRTARPSTICFIYPGLSFVLVLVAGSPSSSSPTTPG
jgi:hypothetical protein